MQPAQYWIEHLQLVAHPEGGYYRELYRAQEQIPLSGLPSRFTGARSFATSIVYLLRAGERSVFHRIRSDETWHFYAGSPLELFQLDERTPEKAERILIGPDLHLGQHLQWTVPAGVWFGSRPMVNGDSRDREPYALLGCTVSPGFDFADFEIADRARLCEVFAKHSELVNELT